MRRYASPTSTAALSDRAPFPVLIRPLAAEVPRQHSFCPKTKTPLPVLTRKGRFRRERKSRTSSAPGTRQGRRRENGGHSAGPYYAKSCLRGRCRKHRSIGNSAAPRATARICVAGIRCRLHEECLNAALRAGKLLCESPCINRFCISLVFHDTLFDGF